MRFQMIFILGYLIKTSLLTFDFINKTFGTQNEKEFTTGFLLSDSYAGILTTEGYYLFDKTGSQIYKTESVKQNQTDKTLGQNAPNSNFNRITIKPITEEIIAIAGDDNLLEIIDKQGNKISASLSYQPDSQGNTMERANILGKISVDVNSNSQILLSYVKNHTEKGTTGSSGTTTSGSASSGSTNSGSTSSGSGSTSSGSGSTSSGSGSTSSGSGSTSSGTTGGQTGSNQNTFFEFSIEEYTFDSSAKTLSKGNSYSFKINNPGAPDQFGIECKYKSSDILCGFINETNSLYVGFIDSFSSIKNEVKVTDKANDLSMLFLTENEIVIGVSEDSSIQLFLYKIEGTTFVLDSDVSIQNKKSGEKYFQISKKDESSIYVSFLDQTKEKVFYIQRMKGIKKAQEIDIGEKIERLVFTPFSSSRLGLFNQLDNEGIGLMIMDVPECEDITKFVNASSTEFTPDILTQNSTDEVELWKSEAKTGTADVVSNKIQYTKGIKTTDIIFYSFQEAAAQVARSKVCSITITTCNKACDTCLEISEDEDEPKCDTCNTGYYSLEDDSSKCFLSTNSVTGYYPDSNEQKFMKCFKTCETCDGAGSYDDQHCLTCQSDFSIYESSDKSCSCDTTTNQWYYEDGLKICVQSCPAIYTKKIPATNQCVKSCPTEYPKEVIDSSECVLTCPSTLKEIPDLNQCVSACTTTYSKLVPDTSQCFKSCPTSYPKEVVDSSECVSTCPSTLKEIPDLNQCVSACTTTYSKLVPDTKQCFKSCPSQYPKEVIDSSECVSTCPSTLKEIPDLNQCVSACTTTYSKLVPDTKQCFKSCPTSYPKEVVDSSECVSTCPSTLKEIPDLNQCVSACTTTYSKLVPDTNQCFKSCPTSYPKEVAGSNECYSSCPSSFPKDYKNICYDTCPDGTEEKDSVCEDIVKSIDDFVKTVDKNIITLSKSSPIINTEKYTYQIYNSSSEGIEEANSVKNTSKIDLGECETILKEAYNISSDESLIILKLDIIREEEIVNQVEYSVYSQAGEKLDLSKCNGTKIEVTLPLKIDSNSSNILLASQAASSNYDIFNSSDPFYTDVCTPYTSEDGTDIPLEDRKTDFYSNVSFCEEGCSYGGIDLENLTVKCDCDVKENMTDEETEFSVNELSSDFKNVFKNSNIKVITCYKLVFNGKKLLNNYGSWLVMFIFLLELILLLIFMKNRLTPIRVIIYEYLNSNAIKVKKQEEKNGDIISVNHDENIRRISTVSRLKSVSGSVDGINVEAKNLCSGVTQHNNLILNHHDLIECSKYKYMMNNENLYKSETSSQKSFEEKVSPNNFTDEELDKMNYKDALKFEHRHFCAMYYSQLKYKQLIIFTFITKTDNNLRLLKISLFLFGFLLSMGFNALFYSDETMSRNYHNKGTLEIIYSLPKTIFSAFFCSLISFLMEFLSLSREQIEKIKNEKNIDKASEISQKFLKCLKIKVIIFFVLIIVLSSFFWYYISAFCAVYVNTQKHLIKDTVLSFGEGMLYPFAFSFFTVWFKLIGIRKQCKCMFYLGKFVEIF